MRPLEANREEVQNTPAIWAWPDSSGFNEAFQHDPLDSGPIVVSLSAFEPSVGKSVDLS